MKSRSTWYALDEGKREVGAVEFQGRTFEATGAQYGPHYLACYPDDKGNVCGWDGTILGTYRVVSSRPAVFFGHRSWIADRYYYMRATVNGTTYAIRGFGPGMIARGKALKRNA